MSLPCASWNRVKYPGKSGLRRSMSKAPATPCSRRHMGPPCGGLRPPPPPSSSGDVCGRSPTLQATRPHHRGRQVVVVRKQATQMPSKGRIPISLQVAPLVAETMRSRLRAYSAVSSPGRFGRNIMHCTTFRWNLLKCLRVIFAKLALSSPSIHTGQAQVCNNSAFRRSGTVRCVS